MTRQEFKAAEAIEAEKACRAEIPENIVRASEPRFVLLAQDALLSAGFAEVPA